MIGFGIMDNFIMIQAGDYIDNTFGATLGIATLTAAAFGQVFSDVSGVLFGGVVERGVSKLGIRPPDISAAQRTLGVCKNVIIAGSVVGVTVGCLLGASCLLFMDLNASERKKKAKELDTILETIMNHGDEVIEAERCSVFWVDASKKELWSRYASGVDSSGPNATIFTVPLHKSIVGSAAVKREVVHVPDVTKDKRFAGRQSISGFSCRSILCAPVFDKGTGEVIAVVEFLNKKSKKGEKEMGFTENDEKLAKMLAYHVGIFTQRINDEEDD
ncbi:hypothetical protein TrCOL_g713 [Triparma columacea]|uniref:GAF domain-containing protein n=1 Tax=Triparma columacea TaxID=722753 RepID=A0A9W7GKY2_9STRA|nr:hypothetical protein TrCOL_g713 [Triparma columacea]